MHPRKVLLIIESSETGGAETVFAELVERLDRSRFVPTVALLHEGWLRARLERAGVEPLMVPTGHGPLDIRLLVGLRALVRKRGIDIVHSHLFSANVYASVACAFTGIPVVSTFHGTMDVASGDRAKWLKWQAINRFSRRVVFVSQYLRDYFVTGGFADPSNATVIYNGVDIGRFQKSISRQNARRELGVAEDAFVVGCVGDIRPAKDYRTALLAISRLRGVIPRLRLLIAGSPTEHLPQLLALRESLGLEPIVEFLGFRPEIERVMPAFDVYLTTSVSEGFSLTVVEAMATGLPVIATRSGGPEEIVRSGETGLLVPVGAEHAVADAIEILFRDTRLRERMANAGVQLATARFSMHAMVGAYQAAFDDVSATSYRS